MIILTTVAGISVSAPVRHPLTQAPPANQRLISCSWKDAQLEWSVFEEIRVRAIVFRVTQVIDWLFFNLDW